MVQNTRCDARKCLLGVHTMADNILGFKFPQNRQKMAFYKHVRSSANGLKTNDVIEDWQHWLAVARGRAAYTIYSILEITAAVFYNIYNATIVSADALYSVRKFSFCKIYTVFVGNLFYRLSHKKIPCAVCWKASNTSKTLISKRWTLHKLRRPNVIVS